MAGFLETKEKVGLIAKLANPVADKKEKKERVTQHADQQWLCAIAEKDLKKDPRGYLGKRINKSMPYVILKKGPVGYKVCKKSDHSVCFSKKPLPKARAERQMTALHIATNENLNSNEVGHALTFDKVEKDNRSLYAKVEYTIAGKEGSKLDIYYKLGKSPEDTDYVFFQVDGKTLEDPHSEETAETLKKYNLSGDDIEMAGQDGYEKIASKLFEQSSEE